MADLGEIQVRSDDPEAREHDHVLNRQRDNALHRCGKLVEVHVRSHHLDLYIDFEMSLQQRRRLPELLLLSSR